MTTPKNAVVVLLDSLNRHMLGSYAAALQRRPEFETPNLDRLAARSARFQRHVTGSLPCMPARHDLLVGAHDFLWRPWGSIELWEDPITVDLRRAGVTTMLVSDHPHLFEAGGENYHTDFDGWDYQRGHESDPWKTVPDPTWMGAPTLPARTRANQGYDISRTYIRAEEEFPGPKVMSTAVDWLNHNAGKHDRFFLLIDEFDPHDPFDTPEPWAHRYDPDWDDELIIWPPYAIRAVERGIISEREARHVRCNYGAKLSMIDAWFGKPPVLQYEALGHIPLLVAWPGAGPRSVDTVTTTVDIHATLCDVFGVAPGHTTHGHSLAPVLNDEGASTREWAIGGIWGNWVQVTDGHRKYARSAVESNFPLSMWSNRWSTMPVHHMPELKLVKPDRQAWLDFMPNSDVPVIRQPFAPGDRLPFWAVGPVDRHHLYDLDNDPDEAEDLGGDGLAIEQELTDMLVAALDGVEAPREQYERLGVG